MSKEIDSYAHMALECGVVKGMLDKSVSYTHLRAHET